jgi:RecB family exonuclease
VGAARDRSGGEQLGFDLLDDTDWVRPLVRVTPARLATWEACPRRYRMTYVDRPAPARGGAWAHSTLGAVVHLALRALHTLPVARRTPETAAALVDRNWSGEGYRDDAQQAEYRERARDWLAEYCAEHVTGPDAEEPLAVERWVSGAVGSIVAEGRVDRIDSRDGDAVIVDYKTGRRVPEPEDARDSPALALYAVAAAHTLRRGCTRVELHHLPSGRVAAWEHDDTSLAGHVARAEATAAEITAAADGGGYPPRTAPHCSTCPVRRHCPEGRAAAPELDPWALLAP